MSRISRTHTLMSVILGMTASGAVTPAVWGQTTAFDYQGQLKDGGVAANGNYNLTFRLFDAGAGGTLVGADVVKPNTPVANGLFSTQLDFGVAPWVPNLPRWLEIVVNGQTLAPRQELTAVPSSLNTRGINVDATGRVGIGTAAPAQKLSVVGTVQSTAGGFMFPDGTVQATAATGGGGFWSANGTHIFKNNSGNVGIGTSTPTESLHLVGDPNRQVVARFDNPGASTGGTWITTGHTATGREWSFGVSSGDGAFEFFNNFAFSSVMRIAQGGDLYVQGNVTLSPSPGASPGLFTGTGAVEHNRYLTLLNSPQFPSASGVKAGGVLVSDSYDYANPGKNDLVVKGSVAIGTGTPAFPLTIHTTPSIFVSGYGWVHTDGTRELGSFVSSSGGWLGTRSAHPLYFFTGNGSAQVTLSTTGNLGVGTTTPVRRLHAAAGDLFVARFESTNAAASVTEFRNSTSNATWEYGVTGSSSTFGLPAGTAYFYQQGTGAPNISMTSDSRTRVHGTLQCNVLEITGADLAEKFPTREEKPEAGTVMEIDPDHPGELRMARQAYSPRVAGVVSGAGDLPVGAVLGNLPKSENSPAIALSGRVWVRCDTTREPITPGDLLTTSDKPGHAMKASDRERSHGAVLGKAMSALKKGETALVLVLVNLQ